MNLKDITLIKNIQDVKKNLLYDSIYIELKDRHKLYCLSD